MLRKPIFEGSIYPLFITKFYKTFCFLFITYYEKNLGKLINDCLNQTKEKKIAIYNIFKTTWRVKHSQANYKWLIASDRNASINDARILDLRVPVSVIWPHKNIVRAANTAICRARRSLRLRYDVQSPWATGVVVEMRFIPSEFWSLALSFSPLPPILSFSL